MKTTQTTTAALALVLSAFLAHGAAAQTDDPNKMNSTSTTTTTTTITPKTLTGKVETKNADSVVVLTDAGDRVTVYTDASSTLPTTSWIVGDRVTVTYSSPTAGRNHADTIVLASAPSTSYPSSTRTADTTTSTTTTETDTSASSLPRTASSTPLALLLGSFAGAAAVGLHLARRNS
jgi:cell wall integrity and stress response component